MKLRQPWEQAVLSGEEIAMIRQVLADCSALLSAALDGTSPQARALLAEATQAATAGQRCPNAMIYRVSLAIDCLDFAPPARRRR